MAITLRKGTFVKRISRKDIQENFPVRAILEGLAAKEAFKKIDAKDLSRMQQVLLKMEQAVKENNPKAYWCNTTSKWPQKNFWPTWKNLETAWVAPRERPRLLQEPV